MCPSLSSSLCLLFVLSVRTALLQEPPPSPDSGALLFKFDVQPVVSSADNPTPQLKISFLDGNGDQCLGYHLKQGVVVVSKLQTKDSFQFELHPDRLVDFTIKLNTGYAEFSGGAVVKSFSFNNEAIEDPFCDMKSLSVNSTGVLVTFTQQEPASSTIMTDGKMIRFDVTPAWDASSSPLNVAFLAGNGNNCLQYLFEGETVQNAGDPQQAILSLNSRFLSPLSFTIKVSHGFATIGQESNIALVGRTVELQSGQQCQDVQSFTVTPQNSEMSVAWRINLNQQEDNCDATNLTLLKLRPPVPFSWAEDGQATTQINAKTVANIRCGFPGLQLYVDVAGVDSSLNCGPKLKVCDLSSFTVVEGESTVCQFQCNCATPESCQSLYVQEGEGSSSSEQERNTPMP